ncbi:MAG TPA: hypothetical protein VGP97_20195 [Burkholderiales bacterium]|nr:hypothetical protein [Burkholderiales bacterium]
MPLQFPRFQPGWATPIAVQHRPSFLAWLLKAPDRRADCIARRQGQCPGLGQCHDCAWSARPRD